MDTYMKMKPTIGLLFFLQTVICVQGEYAYNYVGCYMDNQTRALSGDFYKGKSNNYIQKCIQFCGQLNYKYAGLQYSSECFCGNSGYDKYGEGDGCTATCTGNSSEICGGTWHNSVYSIQVASTTIATTTTATTTTTAATTTLVTSTRSNDMSHQTDKAPLPRTRGIGIGVGAVVVCAIIVLVVVLVVRRSRRQNRKTEANANASPTEYENVRDLGSGGVNLRIGVSTGACEEGNTYANMGQYNRVVPPGGIGCDYVNIDTTADATYTAVRITSKGDTHVYEAMQHH